MLCKKNYFIAELQTLSLNADSRQLQVLFNAIKESGIIEEVRELSLDDNLDVVLTDPAVGDISASQVGRLFAVHEHVGEECSVAAG